MQLHQLKPKHKKKDRKRIGRGGKRGTYSGRGQKGQKSRAGARFKPVIRYLIKRYPKLRGYRFKPITTNPAVVNISAIEKKFEKEQKITPKSLIEKGLVSKIKGRIPKVKILAKGKISKAMFFEGCEFSKQAKEKIEKAKGTIK